MEVLSALLDRNGCKDRPERHPNWSYATPWQGKLARGRGLHWACNLAGGTLVHAPHAQEGLNDDGKRLEALANALNKVFAGRESQFGIPLTDPITVYLTPRGLVLAYAHDGPAPKAAYPPRDYAPIAPGGGMP